MLATTSLSAWAQQLKGVVIDKSSKETLIGEVVTAVLSDGFQSKVSEKDGIKDITDIDGNFSIQDLKDGTYTLGIFSK